MPGTRDGLFTFRDAVLDPTNDYDGDATVEGIPEEIAGLSFRLLTLLQDNGVFYNDVAYPYFFTSNSLTTSFTAWQRPNLKAAPDFAAIADILSDATRAQPPGSAITAATVTSDPVPAVVGTA